MDVHVFKEAIPEVLTQLLGFLIVFWVLKKYAFGAMFSIMDARREGIAKSFKDIELEKQKLEALEKEYRSKIQDIEQEARSKIQTAIREGNRIAEEVKQKANQESRKQIERAKADIQIELDKAKSVLREQMVDISTRMAERIIGKRLSQKDDEAYIKQILEETEREREAV